MESDKKLHFPPPPTPPTQKTSTTATSPESPPFFSPPMNRMGDTARLTLNFLPEVVIDKIINQTSYADDNQKVIHFLKENMGEQAFSKFIYLVTSPMPYGTIELDPSWLTDVIEEYLNLLKSVQSLPNIFVPLRQILDEYVKTRPHYKPKHSDEQFIDLSNGIVRKFITENHLDSNSEVKTFFTNVVNILLKVINDNSDFKSIPYLNLEARLRVKSNIENIIIRFLSYLIELNEDERNHAIIQRFDLKQILDYGKIERESDISKLKKQDPNKYRDEWSIAQGLDKLYEKRQKIRDKQRQVSALGLGGRKKNIRSSRKKRNSKKRTYKKRSSYKK
jgi:hypothetical protein